VKVKRRKEKYKEVELEGGLTLSGRLGGGGKEKRRLGTLGAWKGKKGRGGGRQKRQAWLKTALSTTTFQSGGKAGNPPSFERIVEKKQKKRKEGKIESGQQRTL